VGSPAGPAWARRMTDAERRPGERSGRGPARLWGGDGRRAVRRARAIAMIATVRRPAERTPPQCPRDAGGK